MKRFVRFAAVGFTLISLFYWNLAPDALALQRGSYSTIWLVYALPVILYGVLSVLYLHWLAKRVARMAIPRD